MPAPIQHAQLEELLQTRSLVPRAQLETLVQEARTSGRPLRALIEESGVIPESVWAETLAEQYGLPYDPLTEFRPDPELCQLLPLEAWQRYSCVPLAETANGVKIAMATPHDLRALDALERLLGRPLQVVVAPRSLILAALVQPAGHQQVFTRIQEEFRPVLVRENEQGDEILSVEKITKDQSPIVKLVDAIILRALEQRASDIHLEAADNTVAVKYRVDGVLHPAMDPLDAKVHAPLISRLKVMSELDIAERRVPQDGRFRLKLDRRTVDFRVSILPSAFGESAVIRILDKEHIASGVRGLRLDRLGFNEQDLKRFRRSITAPYGMILMTGPTGSGKTTTVYAAINEIYTEEEKIITIEDPVEYQLQGIVQIPVNEKKGLTFARGLRSILRHDPDKVMVGEIRDAETAQIAIAAALTGHLVFTTVHANNTFDVIGRFVNMGIDPYNFVSALHCILAQRLVRAICSECKTPQDVDAAECLDNGLDPALLAGRPLYHGQGCANCHGMGYRGRYAITEFLDLSDRIKEMILDRKPSSEIRKAALAEGMTMLRQAAVDKVIRGETTLREINRVTFVEENK